jgi:hypothetical protein
MKRLLTLFVSTGLLAAQSTTSRLSGLVVDPQGAAVPGAKIAVVHKDTSATYNATTNERGEYAVASILNGFYRVTAVAQGFRTAVFNDIKVDAGTAATLNVTLEIGQVAETVEVSATSEVLQTTTATVNSVLVGRQISELPFVTRNALEMVITQVGTQTVGTPRTSSINGLPKGSMNITMDGLNIQDNLLRSDDGFFSTLMPKTDAIEEVTIATAGVGAESAGEGAAQVRFVTKGGSNEWHGGTFWQHRNTALNANYFFNNRDGLPRDRMILNQAGGNLGGPILRNRAFFFVNLEEFRLPQSYRVGAVVPTADAVQGVFKWRDTSNPNLIRSVNLYDLARAQSGSLPAGVRPFPTTPDPTTQAILSEYLRLATPSAGFLVDRIATNTDYNRNNFSFQVPGRNTRRFFTNRLDFNLTSRHQFHTVYNYQYYIANPDGVNGIYPVLPGTGTVLGHPDSGGTRRNSWGIVGTLRSTLSSRLTSEGRFGVGPAGISLFREEIVPRLFDQWRGYALSLGFGLQNPQRASSQSRRHTPVWTAAENLTWMRGSHFMTFGGSFTQVNSWQQSVGAAVFPSVTFGIAANDPVNTGATSLFTTTNFPNSSTTNRSDAAAMYALLTGRISSIARSVALDEKTGGYAHAPSVDRNRQREFALYVQDSWRVRPGFTLNYGLRWDVQFPFINLNGSYTRVGYEGVWGLSGVGNLFKPGVLTGKVPQFFQAAAGQYAYETLWRNFAPNLNFAWVIPDRRIPVVSKILGPKAVFRAGYSIATIREGMNLPINLWGSNQGRTVSYTVNPGNFPAEFGPPGSVHFRDATLPARAEAARPTYPLTVNPGNAVNDFDPNLRPGYVQSWNISLQREISRSTVLDIRYVGNHGTKLWRQYNLNEVNIFENGFVDEFKIAQANLNLARQTNPNSTDFGGAAGMRPIPIIQTALGFVSDTTFATYLQRGQAGSFANDIAFNSTRMGNLTRAGYPANFFTVNPTVVNGGAFLLTNAGNSTYNALQLELRRRMSTGFQVQGSYVWSKSLSNMLASDSAAFSQPSTHRNLGYDKGPSPWDIRHGIKLNFIYELPFGPGRQWLSGANPVARKTVEGWQVSGVVRMQSGSTELLTGRATVNQYTTSGGVLHNMTAKQLQDSIAIRKTTAANGLGVVYYLPQDFINNTLAAWEASGFTLANLDRTRPYWGPPTEPGVLGNRVFYYGPWQHRWDLSVSKKTFVAEGKSIEFRANFLNAFNTINFLLGAAGNEVNTQGVGADFGQLTSSYRDITVSGTNDPGGRLIEFMLRFNF